jgi:DNA-binding transcriptional regulator YdaS (Cro superfamily)
MDIRAYLKGEKITLSSMAKDLGCSVTTLHGYVSGRRNVPLRIVIKTEELTGGQVKPADWLIARANRGEEAA